VRATSPAVLVLAFVALGLGAAAGGYYLGRAIW
jgi:hypothetical protein